jgi:hypothetical protein
MKTSKKIKKNLKVIKVMNVKKVEKTKAKPVAKKIEVKTKKVTKPTNTQQVIKKAQNLVAEKISKTKNAPAKVKADEVSVPVEVPKLQSKAFKENLAKLRASSKVPEYSMISRYEIGDKLYHAKFGFGEVVDCIEYNKISVHFDSGDRILIHNDNRNSLTQ